MANSIEKLEQLQRDFTDTRPSEDAEPAELALRTILAMFGSTLRAQLPELPGDLDDLLERGAEYLLSMRSDDAERASIAYTELPVTVPPAVVGGTQLRIED